MYVLKAVDSLYRRTRNLLNLYPLRYFCTVLVAHAEMYICLYGSGYMFRILQLSFSVAYFFSVVFEIFLINGASHLVLD